MSTLRERTVFRAALPVTARQLTDVYLLGLAKRRSGRLATFDRTIPHGAIVGVRPDDLVVISACGMRVELPANGWHLHRSTRTPAR